MCDSPPSDQRNIRLTIAYQGTAYSGWQIQDNAPTVQEEIEQRLLQMTGERCRLRVAGRTDAGVHARGQVANFHTTAAIPLQGFHRGLNALLPEDISILSAEQVAPDFNSRRDNHGKRYRYSIWNTRQRSPGHAPWSWQIHRPLDLQAMADAAWRLVGRHDFSAFRTAQCDAPTTERTIYRCTVRHEQPMVQIDVEGTAFLRNMVRIIAGTLQAIGRNQRSPALIDELLRDGDRDRAGMTAPPHGLCLMKVFL